MDNQLASDVDLAYLAAALDGEGCITLERTGKRRQSTGEMGLMPIVVFTNTNEAFVARICQIIRKIGIEPYIKKSIARRHRLCYWVCVNGLTKVPIILNEIKPYITAKTGQLNLVLDFIDSRLSKGKPKGFRYDEKELKILENIRALNFRGGVTD